MSSQVKTSLETAGLPTDSLLITRPWTASSSPWLTRWKPEHSSSAVSSRTQPRQPEPTEKRIPHVCRHRSHPGTDRPAAPDAACARETGTPLDQDVRPRPAGWRFGLLALLLIACCGLPLLIAAGVTAGSGAVLGDATGGGLMLAAAAVLAIWGMRRRARRTRPVDAPTPTPPSRDRCC